MKTTVQLNAEFYNALVNDAPLMALLTGGVAWIGKPEISDTFPLLTYAKFENTGNYSFGIVHSAETIIFETRHYTDVGDADGTGKKTDKIFDALKTVLHGINYRQINSPADFLDAEINKVVSIVRWERVNAG